MSTKKKLDEGMTLMAYPPAVGGLMGMLPQRVDNFKFKGLPGQFDENGNKILDEFGAPLKEENLNEAPDYQKTWEKIAISLDKLEDQFSDLIASVADSPSDKKALGGLYKEFKKFRNKADKY